MSASTTTNLDRLCAEYGYRIAQEVNLHLKRGSDTENLITKSLGVLQEDGVYAFFLYLASQVKSKGDKESEKPRGARALANQAARLLGNKDVGLLQETNSQDFYQEAMEQIRKEGGLASHIDHLLLAKRLLEQALIYARYHAKALT